VQDSATWVSRNPLYVLKLIVSAAM
jgi:hypothetical protein